MGKSVRSICGQFQSTLPHGERRSKRYYQYAANNVSIHAPAWGATRLRRAVLHSTLFQSTLPHGERHKTHGNTARMVGFNPRSRMGSDAGCPCRFRWWFCFNPRSRMGSDIKSSLQRALSIGFQSTLPHGERLSTVTE